MLILGQKSYFLGPTILKIPQPNWYYSIYLDNLKSKKMWCTLMYSHYHFAVMYHWSETCSVDFLSLKAYWEATFLNMVSIANQSYTKRLKKIRFIAEEKLLKVWIMILMSVPLKRTKVLEFFFLCMKIDLWPCFSPIIVADLSLSSVVTLLKLLTCTAESSLQHSLLFMPIRI